MKITNEIKAKVFAQYLGQEILMTKGNTTKDHELVYDVGTKVTLCGVVRNRIILSYIAEEKYDTFQQGVLILRPLSKITDEDSVEVAKLQQNKNVTEVTLNSDKTEIKYWTIFDSGEKAYKGTVFYQN